MVLFEKRQRPKTRARSKRAGSRSRDEGANTSDEGAAARAETVARTTGAGRLAADGGGVCQAATAAAGASPAVMRRADRGGSACGGLVGVVLSPIAGSAVRGERAVDAIRPYT